MPRMTANEQAELLATPGVIMRIGTVRADGSPLVTPIWFLHEDGSIWFTPREKSEWLANLRRDPRASLYVGRDARAFVRGLLRREEAPGTGSEREQE